MRQLFKFSLFILISVHFSCVKNSDFDILSDNCHDHVEANKSFYDIFKRSTTTATKYTEDDLIEGYVVSNDQGGNFFKTLSLQSVDGSIGFRVAVDLTDLYTLYNPGRKVYLKLKGTYSEIDNDALEIGDLFIDNFNNETVGRLAYPAYEEIILKSCDVVDENQLVQVITIDKISDKYLNTLVELKDVQFTDNALGSTLYDDNLEEGGSSTNHTIEDTSGNNLSFRTSQF